MLRKKVVPDKDIIKKVNQRLARTGLGTQLPIKVEVHNGTVVLSGTIEFEYQRRSALKALRAVDGVRRIVDQLQANPATAKWT